MRSALAAIAAVSLLAGCDSGATEQEEALNSRGSHPEQLAQPAPGDPQLREGPVTPAERNAVRDAQTGQVQPGTTGAGPAEAGSAVAAVALVREFASLLEQGRFGEARQLWAGSGAASGLDEEQFVGSFDGFRTIRAAVQEPGRIEGAAGSQQARVQLTLHGELQSGEPYSRTGLVTLRRANEVPGASEEQRGWRIVRMRLSPNP